MIRSLDLQEPETRKQVFELQLASYRIEAEIIGSDDIPPLKDTLTTLGNCDEAFLGFYINDALAGILSYKVNCKDLAIHRVAVHPTFFRTGIADKLLKSIETSIGHINKIFVSTGKENFPAINLYLKNGYKRIRDKQVTADICITEFEKTV